MRKPGRRNLLYKVLVVTQAPAVLVCAAVAPTLNMSPETVKKLGEVLPWVKVTSDVLRAQAWWLLLMASVMISLFHGYRKFLGAPRTWEAVHSLLESMHKELFRSSNAPIHHNQVTLLRYRTLHAVMPQRKEKKWPWSGWLVPRERSGTANRKSRSAFHVPDDADRAEGVAGMAWAYDKSVLVDELPDLSSGTAPEEIALYASRTNTTVQWVENFIARKQGGVPRSYLGIKITANNHPWGVLMIDSRAPQLPRDEAERAVSLMAPALGAILGGMLK